jgi:lipopolysaccharide export system permease protein
VEGGLLMNTLIRYLTREYLKLFGLTLLAILSVEIAVELLQKIRKLAVHDPSLTILLRYFGLRLPEMLSRALPIAMLLGTILTFGLLKRTNELLAIQAGGISLRRVCFPILLIAMIISLVQLPMSLSVIPITKQKAGAVQRVMIEKKSAPTAFRFDRIWLRNGDRGFVNILSVEPSQKVLRNVTFYNLTPDFRLESSLSGKMLRHEDGRWILYNGIERRFTKVPINSNEEHSQNSSQREREGEAPTALLAEGATQAPIEQTIQVSRFDSIPLDLSQDIEDFRQVELDAQEMRYEDLKRYISRLRKELIRTEPYEVILQNRWALPFAGFLFSLIGAPIGIGNPTRRGLARPIGLALILASAYWFLNSFMLSLGSGGLVSPAAAAWLTNGLLLLIGAVFMIRLRQ